MASKIRFENVQSVSRGRPACFLAKRKNNCRYVFQKCFINPQKKGGLISKSTMQKSISKKKVALASSSWGGEEYSSCYSTMGVCFVVGFVRFGRSRESSRSYQHLCRRRVYGRGSGGGGGDEGVGSGVTDLTSKGQPLPRVAQDCRCRFRPRAHVKRRPRRARCGDAEIKQFSEEAEPPTH